MKPRHDPLSRCIWTAAILLGAALLVVALDEAFGEPPFVYLTDTRRCTAAFGGDGYGSTWQDRPIPFGEYQGGVTIQPSNGFETWIGSSTQDSFIWDDRIAAGLSAQSFVQGNGNPLWAQGSATVDVWFECGGEVQYILAGRSQSGAVALYDLEGKTLNSVTDSPYFNFTGTLPPGVYRLQADATAHCQTPPTVNSATAEVSFVFGLARDLDCRADFNHDGYTNSADFFAFITAWSAGDASADMDFNSVVDSRDFFEFIGVYFNAPEWCQ